MKLLSGNTSRGGHYSPGVIANGMLYISGQLPIDHETGKLACGGAAEHAAAALRNVEAVLRLAGAEKEDVVLCRVYIPDVALWDEVNRAYAAFFGEHKPARVIVPTRELRHGGLRRDQGRGGDHDRNAL